MLRTFLIARRCKTALEMSQSPLWAKLSVAEAWKMWAHSSTPQRAVWPELASLEAADLDEHLARDGGGGGVETSAAALAGASAAAPTGSVAASGLTLRAPPSGSAASLDIFVWSVTRTVDMAHSTRDSQGCHLRFAKAYTDRRLF